MIRVFLCVMDVEFLKELVNLNHENDIQIVGFSLQIPKDLDLFLDLKVDAIIVRDAINVKRANAMAEKIRNNSIYQHIQMIHIFKEIDGNTFHTLTQSCVMNYILAPYTAKEVLQKVKEEVEENDRGRNIARYIEEVGSQILIESGIHDNLKGFSYMKSAAFVIVQNPTRIVMNRVYQEVAEIHETSPDCVEKAIRLAIHQAYDTNPDSIIFQGSKSTNGEVIRMMIELLKIRGMLF